VSGSTVLLISLAGAAAGAWLAYFRWKDKRRPEPWVLLALTAAAGVVSVAAAIFGYEVLEDAGAAPSWGALGGPWTRAVPAALSIGLVEEAAKLLPVVLVARFTSHFDEIWDGPVYAGAAGAGFALAETLTLVLGDGLGTLDGAARAVAAPITHALFAAPAGLGMAHSVLKGRHGALALGFAVSVTCHGAYDLFLARPGLQTAAAGVVLVLWLWLIWAARDLVRRPALPRG
jgi:RsiW-degrading membrane proteinase PrsW (M82 family)